MQQQYSAEFSKSSIIIQDLHFQKLHLQLAQGFNASLYYRRLHNFRGALDEIEKIMELIEHYEKTRLENPYQGYKSVEDLKCLGHYHQAKIHRMLAGFDLDQLDFAQLSASRKCYLEALQLNPNSPIIHSSLGFLYIDMGKCQESLYHHLRAHELHPHFPEYIHGIASAYFNLEKQKADRGEPFDRDNLSKADECFENAIQLFYEFHSINSRIFLDRGQFKMLLGETRRSFE